MSTLLQSMEELQDWEGYRAFTKLQLKILANGDPVYVSKDKIEFDNKGKPMSGYAVLIGKKGTMCVQKLRKEGVLFREGVCKLEEKTLTLEGIPDKAVKGAARTFKKLLLGYKIFGEEEGDDEGEEGASPETGAATAAGASPSASAAGPGGAATGAATAELARKAERIDKAVNVWRATEQAATKELRKLQKAILDLNDPRGAPVIKGLQNIVTKLGKLDDEAKEAADAAARGDQAGFDVARQDFIKKMNTILDYVKKDELIKEADRNPAVSIKIAETLSTSLDRLMKAV